MDASANRKAVTLALWRSKLRRMSDRAQLAALAPHAKQLHTYEWADSAELVKSVRPGEAVVLATARALGPRLDEGLDLLRAILDKGGVVTVLDIDASTATASGAVRICDAYRAGLIGDSRALTAQEARTYGKRKGAALRAARTPDQVAKRCWRDPENFHLSSAELCASHPDMRGWRPDIAAKKFKARGKKAGRPKRKK